MKNRISELYDLLKDELSDAKRRLHDAGAEGRPIVAHQIWQIKRDIQRNSKAKEVNLKPAIFESAQDG